MFMSTEGIVAIETISDNTLISICDDFDTTGDVLMKIEESDLQKDLSADVAPTRSLWELSVCPTLFTCSSNIIDPVDEKDKVSCFNPLGDVVTLVLNVFELFPKNEMTKEGHGAKPLDLLEIELSECQIQADAAVFRTREFKDDE